MTGENPLERAHNAVQARKESVGMASVEDVVRGEGKVMLAEDGRGMLAGTNLTDADIDVAANSMAAAAVAMIASGKLDLVSLIKASYTEGLLVGIEHGKTL